LADPYSIWNNLTFSPFRQMADSFTAYLTVNQLAPDGYRD